MYATPNQIKAIKTLSRMIFRNDEDYREMLQSYGVQSCTKLDSKQATEVIKNLSKGVTKPAPKKAIGTGSRKQKSGIQNPVSSIHLTQLQAERIKIISDVLGWNNTALTQFIQRQTGALKAVQMLMKYEAMKVIVGMTRVLSANVKVPYEDLNSASNNQLIEIFKLNHKGNNGHTTVSR